MTHPDEPIPVPPPAPPPAAGLLIVVAALAGLLWGLVAWQLLVTIPQATLLFRDFNLKLPDLTVWVIRYVGWAALGVFALGLFVLAVLMLAGRGRRAYLWAGVVFGILAPGLLFVLTFLALALPRAQLLEGLSR